MSEVELDVTDAEEAATEDAASFPGGADLPSACVPPEHLGVLCGVLVGMRDEGRTPLIVFPGQLGSAAVPARATLDLHGAHVGREVVLVFEKGDPTRPIIIGCLRPRQDANTVGAMPGQVEVDVDGERLLVTAREQLVLRCGKATITLTKAGKVLLEGTYISSRSSGVNRIKGGSVRLN